MEELTITIKNAENHIALIEYLEEQKDVVIINDKRGGVYYDKANEEM